jgi:hypothetical protein
MRVITKQFLAEYVGRIAAEESKIDSIALSIFKTAALGVLECEPSVAMGLLSEVVKESKVDGKADAATAARMSELRQIYGSVRHGLPVTILDMGRNAAVVEARAYLKDNGITAKGESIAVRDARNANRKLGKAAAALIEEGGILTDEQAAKVESGVDLALVITPEQQEALRAKAAQSVEAEKIRAKLAGWKKAGAKLIDTVLAEGGNEEELTAVFAEMIHVMRVKGLAYATTNIIMDALDAVQPEAALV